MEAGPACFSHQWHLRWLRSQGAEPLAVPGYAGAAPQFFPESRTARSALAYAKRTAWPVCRRDWDGLWDEKWKFSDVWDSRP